MRNPISPAPVQGISDASPKGFFDTPFSYIYEISLTANQLLTGEVISIFTEADFAWRAITFRSTGSFSIQFQDGQGYYLSSGLVRSENMPNTAGEPWPVFPEVPYPAGGRIYLNILDLSGDDNVGQIQFMGVNRYRIS